MKNNVKTAKSNYAERARFDRGKSYYADVHKGKQSCTEKLMTFRVADPQSLGKSQLRT
jgi:hypothetical protein